eukprot:c23422_g1_i5 orf=616-912(+)
MLARMSSLHLFHFLYGGLLPPSSSDLIAVVRFNGRLQGRPLLPLLATMKNPRTAEKPATAICRYDPPALPVILYPHYHLSWNLSLALVTSIPSTLICR